VRPSKARQEGESNVIALGCTRSRVAVRRRGWSVMHVCVSASTLHQGVGVAFSAVQRQCMLDQPCADTSVSEVRVPVLAVSMRSESSTVVSSSPREVAADAPPLPAATSPISPRPVEDFGCQGHENTIVLISSWKGLSAAGTMATGAGLRPMAATGVDGRVSTPLLQSTLSWHSRCRCHHWWIFVSV
jgi:hypothetical protein